jgi:hypothetical protein
MGGCQTLFGAKQSFEEIALFAAPAAQTLQTPTLERRRAFI